MNKRYCKKCKEELPLTRKKIYCVSCKNKIDLESYHKNKEKRKQYMKKYKEANPEFVLKNKKQTKDWLKARPSYSYQWYKNKKQIDINYKIKNNLRERLRLALKNNSKSTSTLELLGCTVDEFKKYIELKFQEGMNWSNYGIKGWHIDHIKPCSKFDLSDPEQQKQCFHYTNLQPLWWKDNLQKYNKL